MTDLAGRLREEILARGPMPFADFMQRCLYDAEDGYYPVHAAVGAKPTDDFVTGPTLGPLLGLVLARWVERQWAALGRPDVFRLVEVGGGPEPLLGALLGALGEGCKAAARCVFVEVSARFLEVQMRCVDGAVGCKNMAEVGDDVPVILLANEVLDAFAVEQYRQEGEAVFARHVGVEGERFTDVWAPCEGVMFDEDGVWEESPAREAWVEEVMGLLARARGAAVMLDYGYEEGHGDSVQGMRGQAFAEVLGDVGRVDLTAHVDFGALVARWGGRLADMGPWLMKQGLLEVAEPLVGTPEGAAALHRLVHPARMGRLFKVWEVTHA